MLACERTSSRIARYAELFMSMGGSGGRLRLGLTLRWLRPERAELLPLLPLFLLRVLRPLRATERCDGVSLPSSDLTRHSAPPSSCGAV